MIKNTHTKQNKHWMQFTKFWHELADKPDTLFVSSHEKYLKILIFAENFNISMVFVLKMPFDAVLSRDKWRILRERNKKAAAAATTRSHTHPYKYNSMRVKQRQKTIKRISVCHCIEIISETKSKQNNINEQQSSLFVVSVPFLFLAMFHLSADIFDYYFLCRARPTQRRNEHEKRRE